MPYPNRWLRRNNFTRDKANGKTFDPAKIDADLNDGVLTVQQIVDRLRGITNADGTLKNLTPNTAMDLLSRTRAVATAGQAAFVVPTYDPVNDTAAVFANGLVIDPASVTQTDATHVTIPARTLGDVVIVLVFTAGSGTLTKLADSTDPALGASLIGVRDAAGLYAGTDAETCLFEVMDALHTLLVSLGDLSTYIRTDGSIAFAGNQAMGGYKLTGLAAATANGDAVRYEQLQAYANSLANIVNNYLPLAGGTLTGNIDLGGVARIVGGQAPLTQDELTTKDYVDTAVAGAGAALVSPTGSMTMFGGSTIPTGWLECNGQAISRTGYANLFTAIGTTWGVGDSVTTFNVPDMRGRAPIGVGQGTADQVVTVALTSGGSSYTSVPTILFSGGNANVQATAEAVLTSGVVTEIRLLTRGSGYTSDPTITITGGGGAGATATVSRLMSTRALGQFVGEESHIQTLNELAHHAHASSMIGGTGAGGGASFQQGTGGYTGDSQPMNVMQPSAALKFIMKT